jgi:cell division protein FtsL
MSSVAQGARMGRTAPRRRTPSRSAARTHARPRLLFGGGVLWIVVIALLLAGVVAVNVAVLRLNLELDQVDRDRSELKADIAGLRSEISTASATARIERLATTELGLVQADPETTIYVQLRR